MTPDAFEVVVMRLAAEKDALLDTVQELVEVVRATGGYTRPEHQATMRGARTLLAEHGRK